MRCRGCSAEVRVSLDAGDHPGGLAVFYCPACGERCQVEHPDGYDPLSVTASVPEG
jgi:transcription elongation factor Elf1